MDQSVVCFYGQKFCDLTTHEGKAFKRCAQHDDLTPIELSRPP